MAELSLCMIVRDEEAVLERCLESVSDAVEEIIIVDTGSVDRTKEIAAKFTEHIYDMPWKGDFSAARNFAFAKATKEYLLWLVFTGKGKTPDDFPTTTDANGKRGNCIRLTTRDTGSFGKMAGMPIAAGNIFIGEFLSENAMKKPLEATRFGMNIAPRRPAYLTGYYKYTPGEVFTDKKKNPVEGRRDTCAIYSVLYEIDPDNFVSLDGSNVTSSDRIVLIAEIKNPGEPDQWTEFMIPFEAMNDKEFDPERLANNGYAIAVVASSSKDGAFFEGAVGSTLHVDELSIIWE